MKFIEMDYKDTLNLEQVKECELVIIVDFSLRPEVMTELRKITEQIIWIDHHITAKYYPYQDLKGLRDFTEKGQSGCELTWRYFNKDKEMPQSVALIGDYDAWRLSTAPTCFQFYEGMKLFTDLSPQSPLWEIILLKDDYSEQIIDAGKSAIKYRDNYCAEICKAFGYETEIRGQKAFATNFYRFGSGGFGELFNKYPLCIAYIHDGKKFTVSLYSTTIDVSEIAKHYGGGGHKGAAGFICHALPWS